MLESSESRSARLAPFPVQLSSTSSSHAASPTLTSHILFDIQDSQLPDDIFPPQSPTTPMSLLFSSPPPSPSPAPPDLLRSNGTPNDLRNHSKWPMHEGSVQCCENIHRLVWEALVHWCSTKWEDEYSHCPWGPEGLLPDTVLTAFVSHGLWRDNGPSCCAVLCYIDIWPPIAASIYALPSSATWPASILSLTSAWLSRAITSIAHI